MTDLLAKAFAEASKLSEEEQNFIAHIIMAEIASEKRWDELFAQSQDLLSELAKEAISEKV